MASVPGPLRGSGHRHHLRGSQHLAEALVLREVEGALAAVVSVGYEDRAAVGESELVAAEGRNPARIGRGGVVKVVAGVKGGVADKLEDRSVEAAGAGAGVDIGKSRSSAADLGRHPAGAGIDAFDRVHVEVGKGGPAHLRVADVRAVHGKGRLNAALPVDGELLREIGCAVGIGHGAGGQQQQGAEVALVERQFADRLAGKFLAAGRRRGFEGSHSEFALIRECDRDWGSRWHKIDRLGIVDVTATCFNTEPVLAGGQCCQRKSPIRAGDRFAFAACPGKPNLRLLNGSSGGIAEHALPDGLRGLLRIGCRGRQEKHRKHQTPRSLPYGTDRPAPSRSPIPLLCFHLILTLNWCFGRRRKKPGATRVLINSHERL